MDIENILKERAIEYCIPNTADIPSDIPDTVIIIQNYKPLSGVEVHYPTISIALAINPRDAFLPKTWLNYTEEKIKKINNHAPKSHPQYKEFTFNELKYYPYSIRVQDFGFANVVNLLDSLYYHITFDS